MAAPASQVRTALAAVADSGVTRLGALLGSMTGSPESIRDGLLEVTPSLVLAYSDGSSALAADWYDDLRDEAAVPKRYQAEPVVVDRSEKIARLVVWASEPMFAGESTDQVALRLLPDVQKEIARPFRDTITTNQRRDPSANGWRRVASGQGCKFCRMLADRGAVYKAETARFAAHGNCHCTAQPVFQGQPGEEATVLQYVASQRRRSEKDRARLREYLNANY